MAKSYSQLRPDSKKGGHISLPQAHALRGYGRLRFQRLHSSDNPRRRDNRARSGLPQLMQAVQKHAHINAGNTMVFKAIP